MDFSTLLSSGSLLYVGLGVAVLLVIILAVFLFRGKPATPAPEGGAPAAVTTSTETQAISQPTETLPSTEVVNQMPVVEQAATQPAEVPKGEVPPLSSWKPSQEAAVIPANDDSTAAPSTVGDSVSSSSAQ